MTTHNNREWEERFDERFIPNDGGIPTYIENGNDLKEFIHQELQKAREEEKLLIKATIETLLLQVQPLPEDADTFMGKHEQTVVKASYMVKEWVMEAFKEADQSELDQAPEQLPKAPEQLPKAPELSEPPTREVLSKRI
jgi:hypothetical protein